MAYIDLENILYICDSVCILGIDVFLARQGVHRSGEQSFGTFPLARQGMHLSGELSATRLLIHALEASVKCRMPIGSLRGCASLQVTHAPSLPCARSIPLLRFGFLGVLAVAARLVCASSRGRKHGHAVRHEAFIPGCRFLYPTMVGAPFLYPTMVGAPFLLGSWERERPLGRRGRPAGHAICLARWDLFIERLSSLCSSLSEGCAGASSLPAT